LGVELGGLLGAEMRAAHIVVFIVDILDLDFPFVEVDIDFLFELLFLVLLEDISKVLQHIDEVPFVEIIITVVFFPII